MTPEETEERWQWDDNSDNTMGDTEDIWMEWTGRQLGETAIHWT